MLYSSTGSDVLLKRGSHGKGYILDTCPLWRFCISRCLGHSGYLLTYHVLNCWQCSWVTWWGEFYHSTYTVIKWKECAYLFFSSLICLSENPRPLKHLCRLNIRKCVGLERLQKPLSMKKLPLPPVLKGYILYKEYDLYGKGLCDLPWFPDQLCCRSSLTQISWKLIPTSSAFTYPCLGSGCQNFELRVGSTSTCRRTVYKFLYRQFQERKMKQHPKVFCHLSKRWCNF